MTTCTNFPRFPRESFIRVMGSFQHQRDPGGDSPDGLSQARSIRRMVGPGKKRLRLSGPGDMVGARDEERSPRWDGKPDIEVKSLLDS